MVDRSMEMTQTPSMARANSKLGQVSDLLRSKNFQMSMVNKNAQKTMWTRVKTEKSLRLLILDSIVGVFIVLNALVIGISTDVHSSWFGWTVLDAGFAFIFATELVVKLRLLGIRDYFFGTDSRWNVFEAVLVMLALVELVAAFVKPAGGEGGTGGGTTNLSLFRILRLTRITRLLRMCRFEVFSELMVMIKGTMRGFKTLLWASLLLSLPLYALSIVFRETLGIHRDEGYGAECFSTVPEAFYTVLRCVLASECTDHEGKPIFALVADHYGWGYAFIYCIVEMLMTFGLFNVIIAIFIENVLAGAKANDQLLKRHRLRDMQFFAQKMTELVSVIMQVTQDEKQRDNIRESIVMDEGLLSVDGVMPKSPEKMLQAASEIEITPEIFEEVRQREGVAEIFSDLALADEDTFNLFETLDADGSGTLDMEELFEGIAKLRGDARRSDVIANNVMLHKLHSELRDLRRETTEFMVQQQKKADRCLMRTPEKDMAKSESSLGVSSDAMVFPEKSISDHPLPCVREELMKQPENDKYCSLISSGDELNMGSENDMYSPARLNGDDPHFSV